MSAFSVQALEEKISRLSLSQDSIETLSLWITQYKACAKDTVEVWLAETKKASADRRLVLFYLANDILQNCHRREAEEFLELFQDPLRHAVSLIGGQKIQTSIERMFRIWKERKVYSNTFLKELEMLIEPVRKTQVNEALPDFKLPLLQDALSEFAKFEAELKVKSSHLSNLRVDISNPTTSLSMLKDKSAGGQVSQHFEEAAQKLQEYTECLVIEVNERINILDMLKECKIFTTYRMAELQRIIADYNTLGVSVADLKDKLCHRLKDLERAKSTATSDPSAKDDITDVGDMEIESDGEESQKSTPKLEQNVPQSLMSSAPGMMTSPISAFPRSQPSQNVANDSYPPLPTSTFRTQAPPLPRQPTVGQVFRARPGSAPFQNRPMLDTSGRGLAQRPRPPPHRPPLTHPPLQRFPGRPRTPQVNNYRGMRPPIVRGLRPPFRPAAPRPPPTAAPRPPNQHTISSSPILYNKQQNNPAAEQQGQGADTQPPLAGGDAKPSLDDRLKDMMLNKKFSGSVLNEPPVDSRPYSPSAADNMVTNNTTNNLMDDDADTQSLPTPSSDSPMEEASPKPNMDNPILKALYKSQSSPEASLVPDYEQEDSEELSSDDLKNILDQVKSSEPAEPASDDQPAVARAAKIPAPAEIKITPTLTNLLDEIFPQISQSLMNRKRKQEDGPNNTTKTPRLVDMPLKPTMPPQFDRARFPPPGAVRVPVSSTFSARARPPLSSVSVRAPRPPNSTPLQPHPNSAPPVRPPPNSAPPVRPPTSAPPSFPSAPVRPGPNSAPPPRPPTSAPPFSSAPPLRPPPNSAPPVQPPAPSLQPPAPPLNSAPPVRLPPNSAAPLRLPPNSAPLMQPPFSPVRSPFSTASPVRPPFPHIPSISSSSGTTPAMGVPRQPFSGTRVPFPGMPGLPPTSLMAKTGDAGYFGSYEMPRFGGPTFMSGVHPRVPPYGTPPGVFRPPMTPPGYRPLHPRYA